MNEPLTKDKIQRLIYNADPEDEQFEVVADGEFISVENVHSAVEGMKKYVKSPDKEYILDLIDYFFPIFKED